MRSRLAQAKVVRLCSKIKSLKMAGSIVQEVEHLTSTHKALSTAQKNNICVFIDLYI
jgi:hypothetical protein